jgi:hypothetical protein
VTCEAADNEIFYETRHRLRQLGRVVAQNAEEPTQEITDAPTGCFQHGFQQAIKHLARPSGHGVVKRRPCLAWEVFQRLLGFFKGPASVGQNDVARGRRPLHLALPFGDDGFGGWRLPSGPILAVRGSSFCEALASVKRGAAPAFDQPPAFLSFDQHGEFS